jgi:hypothetical protein
MRLDMHRELPESFEPKIDQREAPAIAPLRLENYLNESSAAELVDVFDDLLKKWRDLDLEGLDDLSRAKHEDIVQELELGLAEASLAKEQSLNRARTLEDLHDTRTT